MPRLSAVQRERAIGRLDAGERPNDVARTFGVHVSTIQRLRARFQATNSTADRPRSGRPRVTNRRADRYIVQTHRRNRLQTATATAGNIAGTHGRPMSRHTVSPRLRHVGLRRRRPYHGPVLTQRHRQDRLNWAQRYINWRLRDWSSVLFTDECLFTIHTTNRRLRIYREEGERYQDNCVIERDRWGGHRVMIWGGIMSNRKVGPVILQNQGQGQGRGLNAAQYIVQVLRPHVVPLHGRIANFRLQQDNARAHTARVTREFLQRQGITVHPHPALSPDLNPIENLWDFMKRQLEGRQPRPRTLQELQQAIQDVWRQVPMNLVNNLVGSMYRRCRDVV